MVDLVVCGALVQPAQRAGRRDPEFGALQVLHQIEPRERQHVAVKPRQAVRPRPKDKDHHGGEAATDTAEPSEINRAANSRTSAVTASVAAFQGPSGSDAMAESESGAQKNIQPIG